MLFPHGADFLGRRKLAAFDLGLCLGQIGFFLRRQPDRRLIDARELQHDSSKLVLPRVGKSGYRAKRLFKETGHQLIISRSAIPVETAKYSACGVRLEGLGKTGALDCSAPLAMTAAGQRE